MKIHRPQTAFIPVLLPALIAASSLVAEVDKDALPDVEEGFSINFFVKEPPIINPSALCFEYRKRVV